METCEVRPEFQRLPLIYMGKSQRLPPMQNADTVLAYSQKMFGRWLVNKVIKHTFFAHFCAGPPSLLAQSEALSCRCNLVPR